DAVNVTTDDRIGALGFTHLAKLISAKEEVVEVDDTVLIQVCLQGEGRRGRQQEREGEQDTMSHPANDKAGVISQASGY
ncbi:MAG TPA: hypothetical protein DIC52_06275, partial [Candidatus Latescibacteria bacterium]|nr:hypothetical protein [Candidatus Latescibacterota bacterium]